MRIGDVRSGCELVKKVSAFKGQWRCPVGHEFDRTLSGMANLGDLSTPCPECRAEERARLERAQEALRDAPGYMWSSASHADFTEHECRLCGEVCFARLMSGSRYYCRACDQIRARIRRQGGTLDDARAIVEAEMATLARINDELAATMRHDRDNADRPGRAAHGHAGEGQD